MFQCRECGRTFRTAAAAHRAATHGCPRCGGVDIDLAATPDRAGEAAAQPRYPLLTAMIRELARDNYGTQAAAHTRPETEWVWPADANHLESLAARLTADERSTLVAGEESEQQAVIRRLGVEPLWQFVCDVFDGPLSGHFFVM